MLIKKERGKNFMKKQSILDYVAATATCNSEEDLETLLKVLNPTDDREVMSEVYTAALGYNPITFFDENDLRKIYKCIIDSAPDEVKDQIGDREDDIIDDAMLLIDESREDTFIHVISNIIKDITGWSNLDESEIHDDNKKEISIEDDDDDDDDLFSDSDSEFEGNDE